MKLFFFLINALLIYIFFSKSNFIGNKLKLIDNPNSFRKKHLKPTPVIGGLILFFSLFFLLITDTNNFYNFFFINNIEKLDKLFFLLIIFSFFIVGIADDKYDLRPLTKIFFYIIILLLLFTTNTNFVIKTLKLSFYKDIDLFQYGVLFSILAFIFFINSINMFDGINLQSSSLFLTFWIYLGIKFGFDELSINIIIFLLIFSYFNFRGKTFLGDSGIYLISILAYLYFLKIYNFSNKQFYLDEIFCIFLLPFIDTLRVIIIRFKNNLNIFGADNNHFHYILNKNFNYNTIVIFVILGYLFPIVLYNFIGVSFGTVLLIFLIFYFYIINFDYKKRFYLF
jgi:UDP-GlcNAc:undecaprenyl-phosphate GlcNAc-1-phosphate transferase